MNKVFVVHELENDGCCEADGGDHFTSVVHGVFSTEKAAKAFIKKDKYLKSWEVKITEVELNPKDRYSSNV